MKRLTGLVAILLLAAGPAIAGKVYVSYDPSYDLSGVESFAWDETSETSVEAADPLLHSRILNGIEYYLTVGGAREVDRDPDVYVTYHTSTKTELSVDTSYHGYGYPSTWGWYGRPYPYGTYGSATSTVNTYRYGTLIVDVWDADSKKIVWRGTAADITITDNPTTMDKRIDKALKKMVKKWGKIKSEAAKAR